jgi:hypothetical protein
MQAGTPKVFFRASAPADLKKDAGGFDLPIALGLLPGSGQVAFDRPGSFRGTMPSDSGSERFIRRAVFVE